MAAKLEWDESKLFGWYARWITEATRYRAEHKMLIQMDCLAADLPKYSWVKFRVNADPTVNASVGVMCRPKIVTCFKTSRLASSQKTVIVAARAHLPSRKAASAVRHTAAMWIAKINSFCIKTPVNLCRLVSKVYQGHIKFHVV